MMLPPATWILTFAVVVPLTTATILPGRTLRAEIFMIDALFIAFSPQLLRWLLWRGLTGCCRWI